VETNGPRTLAGALSGSEAEFVLVVHAGVVAFPSLIEKMARVLFTTPGAGLVGPLARGQSKAERGWEAVEAGCASASAMAPIPRLPALNGACLGIRREIVGQIGTPDDAGFPAGLGWDVDFCFRAADAGYSIVLATDACCEIGASDRIDARHREAAAALKASHGVRRVSRAFMTLLSEPIVERQRQRMRRESGLDVDIPLPSVLLAERRRRHP
jgi:hypothetical protein